jgi:hypothetical protein
MKRKVRRLVFQEQEQRTGWRAHKQQQQEFTYSTPPPMAQNINPNILIENANSPIAALGPDLQALQAARPYPNFGMDLPHWGAEDAVKDLSGLGQTISNALINAPSIRTSQMSN